jgi:outer membrane receptor protein involved in Fe transport
MKFLYLFSAVAFFKILFVSNFVEAQSIKGRIMDGSANEPIEYASVAIYKVADSTLVAGTVTDPEGDFEISDLIPGSYYLTAQFMGYNTKSVGGLEVERNQNLTLDPVLLFPNEKLLEEIEVRGERVTAMHKIDRQSYEAGSFQSSRGGNATDVLRNLPSVSLNAQGEISVRGSTGFAVLLNGKPIQTDPSVLLSQLPANAVQNIEVITAPSASYDPEGKAGILNIITTKNATDGLYMQVNAKLGMPSLQDYDNVEYAQRHGADFTLNYTKDKWDLSVGASYLRDDIGGRRVGDVYTILNDTLTRFPSDGERSSDVLNYSGRFTLGFSPNENNNFSLGFYGGRRSTDRLADIVYYDNHAIAQSTGERLYTLQYFNHNLRTRRGDFLLGSFDYSHTFKNQSKLSSSLLYEYTMLGGPTINQNVGWPNMLKMYQDEYNTNDNPLHGTRFQIDYQSAPFSLGTIEAGYQFRNLDHIGDFLYERRDNETGIFELVPDFSSTVNLKRAVHSMYGQLSGKKGKISYGAGVRVEVMDRALELKDKAGLIDTVYRYAFIKPYPSANLQYEVSDELRLKTAYTRRVERTTTFKMNPFPEREHSETLEQGDPTLKPEFIDMVELGAVKDFGNNSVFVTSYFRNVKNVINRVNTVYNDSILNRIYSNVGSAQSVGFELGTELNPYPWWKIFAGGNFYNYSIEGSFNNRPINTSSWVYSINANTTFDITETFNVQWSLNYLSDRITAQGVDSRFLSPNLSVQKTFLNNRLTANLQWHNMDMGLLPSNQQRITTWREGEFYTTTNYIYEVDVIMINLSYSLNRLGKKGRFIESEFGEKEF